MKISTVKGTRDFLPCEAKLRTHLQNTILSVYEKAGFEQIITPILEDIENLNKSDGGENLNLLFKILKRGSKLDKALEGGKDDDLTDLGLRYDLTLPLSRYYANNKEKLLLPMKCIQIDRVYRAERPQKGRLREFVQCDIDIIGSSSIYSEIELIDVTAKALLAIGITDFIVHINDRSVLKLLLLNLGFQEEQMDSLCISFDKLDKIGIDGMKKELEEKQMSEIGIKNLIEVLSNGTITLDYLKEIENAREIVERLEKIINITTALAQGQYSVQFDISLIRGQGYYTGSVFEIRSKKYNGSIAGGGRYDNLIGKFIKEKTPAVGFSIGFERIFELLLADRDEVLRHQKKKIAVFFDADDYVAANRFAAEKFADYNVSLMEKPAKFNKYLSRLQEQEYKGFFVFGKSEEITLF